MYQSVLTYKFNNSFQWCIVGARIGMWGSRRCSRHEYVYLSVQGMNERNASSKVQQRR